MENGKIRYIMSFFDNNPVFNIITLTIAIIGIVFTYIFYIRSKKIKKPIYVIKTNNLVKKSVNEIQSIQILFTDNIITNLSVTKIALWNDGKDTISNTDIAKNNPVKIKIDPSFEILEAEIIYSKKESNDFKLTLSEDRKYITINFDFFDFEEGVVIQLFHTANSSDDISIVGTIKSVKEIKRKVYPQSIFPSYIHKVIENLSLKHIKVITSWSMILTGVLFPIILLYSKELADTQLKEDKPWYISFIASLLPSILYIWIGYRTIKRTIPKGFDIFKN